MERIAVLNLVGITFAVCSMIPEKKCSMLFGASLNMLDPGNVFRIHSHPAVPEPAAVTVR